MSAIEWTDETWNPVTGCTKVSPGCAKCYMFRDYPRLKAMGVAGYQASPDVVTLRPGMIERPLRWRRPRFVFVNSMSDLFHEDVPDDFIDEMFAVMARTQQHTYQILTKRPERMRAYFGQRTNGPWIRVNGKLWAAGVEVLPGAGPLVLPNVWLGVSVEDQERADQRIPILLDTDAAIRFLSCEPLLGPINLPDFFPEPLLPGNRWAACLCLEIDPADRPCATCAARLGIDWVIAGGESGPGARFCDPGWLRSLRNQCTKANVPYFLKQLGGRGTSKTSKRSGDYAILDGQLHHERPSPRPPLERRKAKR